MHSTYDIYYIFFSPSIFYESTQIRYDVTATSITILYFYSYLSSKKKIFLLSGLYLALLRETSLSILVSILLIEVLTTLKNKKKIFFYTKTILIQVAFYSLFFIKNYIITGKLTLAPALDHMVFSFESFSINFKNNSQWIFIENYRWLFTIISPILLALKKNDKKIKKITCFILLNSFFFLFVISFHKYSNVYYFNPILPFIYIIGAIALDAIIEKISKKNYNLIIFTCLFSILALEIYHPSKERLIESSKQYPIIVNHFSTALNMVNMKVEKGSNILTDWPFDGYLKSKAHGYLTEEAIKRKRITTHSVSDHFARNLLNKDKYINRRLKEYSCDSNYNYLLLGYPMSRIGKEVLTKIENTCTNKLQLIYQSKSGYSYIKLYRFKN